MKTGRGRLSPGAGKRGSRAIERSWLRQEAAGHFITMQEFEEDYYAVLGVEETAPPEEIRKAFLRLAKKLHPDRYPNDAEKRALAQTEFAKVTRAHEIISDAQRRAEYDTLRSLSRRAHAPTGETEQGPGNATEDAPVSVPPTHLPGGRDDENINV